MTVKFITHYGAKLWEETVVLQNPYKPEAVKVSATSFRDKLVPGDMEHWTFSITDQNGKPMRGAMMLDMFDKAIASIEGNDWSFGNWRYNNLPVLTYTNYLGNSNSSWANWMGRSLNVPDAAHALLPSLYTYNQSFFD